MSASPQFLLASRSPRRRDLLGELGYDFAVDAADINERPHRRETGADFARRMAAEKAAALCPQTDMPVLAADTDVEHNGRILGKPDDAAQARALLLALAESTHRVHCAVALATSRGSTVIVQTCTEVTFGAIPEAELDHYCASAEPLDKAGGYAIQGYAARWVRSVQGSYSGVIGLPVVETRALFADIGIHPRRVRPT